LAAPQATAARVLEGVFRDPQCLHGARIEAKLNVPAEQRGNSPGQATDMGWVVEGRSRERNTKNEASRRGAAPAKTGRLFQKFNFLLAQNLGIS
jgi:hypothetical protein